MATKVVIYGLSTEGYSLACKIALNGGDVQIIDESTPSAISIKEDIANSYPTVQALKDDEPLLAMTSIDAAISKAQVLIFAPKIRKTGQDIKIEINSKFKDAVSNIKKNCLVVNGLGTGFGGNSENMSLLEHVTGLKVGKNVSYFYYPLSKENTSKSFIGSSVEVLVENKLKNQNKYFGRNIYLNSKKNDYIIYYLLNKYENSRTN